MIFTFWTRPPQSDGSGGSFNSPAVEEWISKVRGFRVLSDDDARAALALHGADLPKIYDRIRIPACRSDLARLALLYEHGGLYIDAHAGTSEPWRLAEMFHILSYAEVVLFDLKSAKNAPDILHIPNGALVARRHSQVIKIILESAIENLRHFVAKADATDEFVEYNIAQLTGGGPILKTVFNLEKFPHIKLKDEYQEKVVIVTLVPDQKELPFHFYKHYSYREPGMHWSERQKLEPLLNPQDKFEDGVDNGSTRGG